MVSACAAANGRAAKPVLPRRAPQPRCPLRPGEPCTLCQLDVTGPQDCGLVYLVMHDDDLREGLRRATNQTRVGRR
jgi:Domain of unknown function (DUF6767)